MNVFCRQQAFHKWFFHIYVMLHERHVIPSLHFAALHSNLGVRPSFNLFLILLKSSASTSQRWFQHFHPSLMQSTIYLCLALTLVASSEMRTLQPNHSCLKCNAQTSFSQNLEYSMAHHTWTQCEEAHPRVPIYILSRQVFSEILGRTTCAG